MVPEVVVPSFVGAPVENFALGILPSAKQALSSAFRVRLHWWMGAHLGSYLGSDRILG